MAVTSSSSDMAKSNTPNPFGQNLPENFTRVQAITVSIPRFIRMDIVSCFKWLTICWENFDNAYFSCNKDLVQLTVLSCFSFFFLLEMNVTELNWQIELLSESNQIVNRIILNFPIITSESDRKPMNCESIRESNSLSIQRITPLTLTFLKSGGTFC